MVPPTTDFADLVLHALAHVPLRDHTSLHDARYVAWAAREDLPVGPIAEDAALVAALYARDPARAVVVHALPRLHRSIGEFLAAAGRDLDALADVDVDDAALLDALCRFSRARESGGELVEILRADLALVARDYARRHVERVAPLTRAGARSVEPFLAEARALVPSLAAARVELALALGSRGRALGGWILVGAPAPWNELDSAVPAVVAMHEAAVEEATQTPARAEASAEERYVRSELVALARVARAISRASPALRDAHATWLGALALAPLLGAATSHGLLDDALACHVRDAPTERVRLLTSVELR